MSGEAHEIETEPLEIIEYDGSEEVKDVDSFKEMVISDLEDFEDVDEEVQPKCEPYVPSELMLKLVEIAKEEEDELSDATLREVETWITPEKIYERGLYVHKDGPAGKEIDLEGIKDTAKVVKLLAEKGKFISKTVAKYLGPIGTVAAAIIDIAEFFEPEKEDPVLKELGEVKHQIEALSKQMTAQFDDLKSFIVEQEFFGRFTIGMSTLMMYMIDTFGDNKKEAIKHFEETYNEYKPQKSVYELLARLEYESTNPLKWAMKGDPLMTTATFEKWQEILDSVLGEALFLEIFASGLLKNVGGYGVAMILEKIARYYELVKIWDLDYRKNAHFWPTKVETLVEKIQLDSSLNSDEKKLTKIWESLKLIHTDDKFYAVCYESGLHMRCLFPKKENLVWPDGRGGYQVLIYRVPNPTEKLIKQYKERMNNYMMKFTWLAAWTAFDNKWKIAKSWLSQERAQEMADKVFGNYGIFLAILSGNVATRCDEWPGPGMVTYDSRVTTGGGKNNRATYPVYFLVAE